MDRIDAAAVRLVREAGHEPVERTGLAGDALVEALDGCAALLVRSATKVTADVLERAGSLRVVVRAGTGLDNVDAAAAERLGIRVFNTPAANAVSVAELVFALLLAFERHVVAAATDTRGGGWEKSRFAGRELAGRTLGLVGFGRIGREVADRAHAFGLRVLAHDPALAAWPAGYERVESRSLEALLPESNVLSLHVPLTEATRGMIGAAELARLPKDAIVVNCSRGGTVDERALHEALVAGTIRGACLDVFEREPPADSPLLALPNVLALPHLGASTREAQTRAGAEAARIAIEALATLGR